MSDYLRLSFQADHYLADEDWQLHCDSLQYFGTREGAVNYLNDELEYHSEVAAILARDGLTTGEQVLEHFMGQLSVDCSHLYEIYVCDENYFIRYVI